MTSALNKQRTGSTLYMCQVCEKTFELAGGQQSCPNCGAFGRDIIVPIYVETEPEKEQLYTDDDWHAGD